MSEPFDSWREALAAMSPKAASLCNGLTEEQINWRPDRDHWSIAQCLDHLNRANGKIATQLEEGIRKAKATGSVSTREWKPGWLERLFIRMVGANAPIKSPVPPDFEPTERALPPDLLPAFEEIHRRFLSSLDDVERFGLIHVKVGSPVSRLVKCSLGAWFAATIEHDLYHLGQADDVRRGLRAQVAISE